MLKKYRVETFHSQMIKLWLWQHLCVPTWARSSEINARSCCRNPRVQTFSPGPWQGASLACSGTSNSLHQTSSKVVQETWRGSLLLFSFPWESCWEPHNYRSPLVWGLRTTTPSEVQCLLTSKWGCVSFITNRDLKAEECVYLKASICNNGTKLQKYKTIKHIITFAYKMKEFP